MEDCGTGAQYQLTVSGIANGTLSCAAFNRTWTLSYDGSTPIANNPEWREIVSSRYAIIYYDEPFHVLGFGPQGIYVFTVAYLLSGNWDCGLGATNVFTRNYVFDGCTGWPDTITVTRIA